MNIIKPIYYNQFLLLLLWIVIILCVNPQGDFPINDDWAYSQNVYELSENGRFKFSPFPAMTLVAQTLWGALVSKIFGFSFFVLRISTVFLAVVFSQVLYSFIKKESDAVIALFTTISVLLSPLFIPLSFSFMTEIPYLLVFLLSIKFYLKFLNNNSKQSLLLAIIFSILALLIRQTGLIIPIAFGLTYLLIKKISFKRMLIAAVPFLINSIVLIVYTKWRIATNNIEGSFSNLGTLLHTLLNFDITYFSIRIGTILLNIGFYIIPISLVILIQARKQFQSKNIWKYCIFTTVLMPFLYLGWIFLPAGNIFYNFGVNPRVLKEVQFGLNRVEVLPNYVLEIIRILSSFSILTFGLWSIKLLPTRRITKQKIKDVNYNRNLFLGMIISGIVTYLILNPTFFDRYLLPISMLLVLIWSVNFKANRKELIPSVILLVFFGLGSVILTHDFFSWNRARWEAIEYLTEDLEISPKSIDGGVEFNGWYKTGPWRKSSPSLPNQKSWWFVEDDEYLIATGDFPGYEKLKTYNFQLYLPQRIDSVFILKRLDSLTAE